MSHAATLDRSQTPRRLGTATDLKKTIDRWLPSRRIASDRRPLEPIARVVPFTPRAAFVPRAPRHRPEVDMFIELDGTHGTLRQGGRSVMITGAGDSLPALLLAQIAHEASVAGRSLVVVVREQGHDVAMSVHPGGSVESLFACCA
jgi:protein-L-isoaspartate O-methyltransferase